MCYFGGLSGLCGIVNKLSIHNCALCLNLKLNRNRKLFNSSFFRLKI